MMMFQFTHSGRGATTSERRLSAQRFVSIHAPREGCDGILILSSEFIKRFNSRTPGGVRLSAPELFYFDIQFQFTHPGRGATRTGLSSLFEMRTFQFTHPGRGATVLIIAQLRDRCVSIHAPREGCD